MNYWVTESFVRSDLVVLLLMRTSKMPSVSFPFTPLTTDYSACLGKEIFTVTNVSQWGAVPLAALSNSLHKLCSGSLQQNFVFPICHIFWMTLFFFAPLPTHNCL